MTEAWDLVAMATIGQVEAALFRGEDGRRWTVLCEPGAIERVQSGDTDPERALFGSERQPRQVEQLVGWPEDWTEVEERIVNRFKADVYPADTNGPDTNG